MKIIHFLILLGVLSCSTKSEACKTLEVGDLVIYPYMTILREGKVTKIFGDVVFVEFSEDKKTHTLSPQELIKLIPCKPPECRKIKVKKKTFQLLGTTENNESYAKDLVSGEIVKLKE